MDLNRIARPIALVAVLLLATGCVIGNEYDYDSQTLDLAATSDDRIMVIVLDQREYVLSGHNSPNFVGLQRSGFGIPYDVTTVSGAPLADDMATTIVRGLAVNGVDVFSVVLSPSADPQIVFDAVAAGDADRALVVYMREWKTDTMVNIGIRYNLEAVVMDRAGIVLGRSEIVSSHDEDIGGAVINPVGYAIDNVPVAQKRLLEQLLNYPEIVAALE